METVSDYVKAISAQGRDMDCVILYESGDALVEAILGFRQTVYDVVDVQMNNVFHYINTSAWNEAWTSSLCALQPDVIIILDCKDTHDIIPKCMSRIRTHSVADKRLLQIVKVCGSVFCIDMTPRYLLLEDFIKGE